MTEYFLTGYNPFGSVSPVAPTPTPTPAQIAETLKQHAKEGRDLSVVHAAISEIKAETEAKERTKKTLQGVVETAKRGAKARRFVVAYHHNGGTAGSTEGVEYSSGAIHVKATMQTPTAIDGMHANMTAMKAKLDKNDIAHHIEYLD